MTRTFINMNDQERLVKKYSVAKILWTYRKINKGIVFDILSKFSDKDGNTLHYDKSEFSDIHQNFMAIFNCIKNVSDETLECMSKL